MPVTKSSRRERTCTRKAHSEKDMDTRIAQLTNSNETLAGRRVSDAALQWERRRARAKLHRSVGGQRGLDIQLPLRVVAMLPSIHITGAHIGGLMRKTVARD